MSAPTTDIPDTAIRPDGYTAPPIPEPQAPPVPEAQPATIDFPDTGVPLPDPGQLQQIVEPVVQETRRGYKTSEFWSSLAILFTDIATSLPAHDKLLITILGGAYAIARGVAKNGVPNIISPEAPKE